MTSQLFATNPSLPPLRPAGRLGRWVLHRAGIVNVWEYDRAELSFADGRVLLRGSNGAGKSKALEVLLPFLLDGDTRSIDATGRDRTSVYWLMTDRREAGNHVGYVWLELRMTKDGPDGETIDRFLTIGAGMKAASSTRQSATWFFMTEDARVGELLHLGAEISIERLRDQIGSEAVTQSGAEHRRRVAAKLFGVQDETRYRGLVHLLHRLRDPNIGNRVEAGELASLLSDALPPLSDYALDKAAERFEALEQIREQLERVERTAAALERFLVDYSGYAKARLAERAEAVVAASAGLRRTVRERDRLAAEVERRGVELADAEQQVEQLRETVRRAGAELEALQASEAYQQHRQLDDRRRVVAAKASEAATAGEAARAQQGMVKDLAREVERLGSRAEEAARLVREARAELERHAKTTGLDPAVVPAGSEGIAASLETAHGRRRAAQLVRSLAVAATGLVAAALRADEQAARSESELAECQSEADRAAERWRDATNSWLMAMNEWAARELPESLRTRSGGGIDPVGLEQALEAVPSGATEDQLAAVLSLARVAGAPVWTAARALEVRAHAVAEAVAATLHELEVEHAALESQGEARPVRSRFRDAERDPNAGAGFYELVELAPGLEPDAVAGLEAALEASGLLDAWVSRAGLVFHPETHDVVWRADAEPVPEGRRSLGDVLVPANEQVAALLQTIALEEASDDEGGSRPYVTLDGRWSLPPLQGSWMKPRTEFLGAPARRATRALRLADLARRIDEQSDALKSATEAVSEAGSVAEQVEQWLADLPPDGSVRTGAAEARYAGQALQRARVHHDEDRRLAEKARAEAAVARAELEHGAAADALPRTVDELDVVIESAGDLVRALRRWETDWHRLAQLRGELGDAQERQADRERAAAAAKALAGAREAELEREQVGLRTLERAIGASVDEVLRQIEDAALRRSEASDAEPVAQTRVTELAGEKGQAIGRYEEMAHLVEDASALLGTASERLGAALRLPGVAAAALGADWSSCEARDPLEVAGDLLQRLGEFTPVSDSTILNRLHLLADGLSGGYDVVDDEADGIKFILVADDAGRQPLASVSARVCGEAAAARERLAAGERETIERFLLGELGEEVRERLLEAHDLVCAANQALASVHSSHGKGVRLDWSVDDEAIPGARAVARLLVMCPRSPEEDAELRDVLLALIRNERERDPAAGYAEHLRAALDYRRWYRFTVQVTDEARWPGPRVLSPRLGLSQGEQRVLSYLALFAAASAHFDSFGAGCPRLLLLDDAFAKVDEPTHGRLLELLVDLDLDFMITSERLWGCFPQVPSLEIYEVLRDPAIAGVAFVHFHWDGHERRLVGI